MSGKHAPASPRSFYISLAKSIGGSLAAVALMLTAVLVVLNNRDGRQEPSGFPTVGGSPTHSPTPGASSTPTVLPTATTLPASKVTVDVRNGTARAGLAANVAERIRKAGYAVVTVGNNPSHLAKSTIFYRPGSLEEAKAFQRRFPEFTVLQSSTATGSAVLRVVIGADFPKAA